MNIKRSLPVKKTCSFKFSEEDIEKYFKSEEVIKDMELKIKRDTEFLEKGINYITRRKIKIHGRTYDNISRIIWLRNSKLQKCKEISKLNKKVYLKELRIELEKIDEYNKKVERIIEDVKKLKWDEFIELDGEKYGIPEVYNMIHRENNCLGKMIEKGRCVIEYECSHCKNWYGYSGTCHCYNKIIISYKCDKCGYERKISDF